MNTFDALMMGVMNRGKEPMVFDWDKAARLILESGCKTASAGLRGDWAYTGGVIFEGGKPVTNSYTFLSSTWAVPEIEIDGERYPCFRMQHEVPKWGAETKWAKSALKILQGE